MNVFSILAVSDNDVLGDSSGKQLWHISDDLKHFRDLTMGHTVLMGRKTYEAIGRRLPGRLCIVLTRQRDFVAPGCVVCHSLDEAMTLVQERLFIIGGAEIFAQTVQLVQKIYLTRVHISVSGDVMFRHQLKKWKITSQKFVAGKGGLDVDHTFYEYIPTSLQD